MSPRRAQVHAGSAAPMHTVPRPEDLRTVDNDAQAKFYASTRWKKVRMMHRASEPLCRHHLKAGMAVPADMIDHVVPIRDGGAPLEDSNLESLCWACHRRKTEEDKRNG